VARGFTLILRGYQILIVSTLAGLGLMAYWQYQDIAYTQAGLHAPDDLLAWQAGGLALLLFGPLTAGVVVLIGQWRCLGHATERHGAKSLMYACLICLILSGVVCLAGVIASAAELPKGLETGWADWNRLEFSVTATIAQVASLVVLVLSMLLFTLFLRAVATCFRDERRTRHIEGFFLFTGFLLGGSVFVFLGNRQLSSQPDFLLGLAGCWVFAFLWHFVLVGSTRRCIRTSQTRQRPHIAL
jgi:hypothetical protein